MDSGKIQDIKKFESVVSHGVTLVDFNAPWCAPCRVQHPIIEELSEDFKGQAAIIEINVDENKQTALHLGIASIPTLIIFKDGKEVTRFVGLQRAESLSKAIRRTLRQ
ncbi:MAG: thioredoxin [Deltaproteobacteria bacterium]|nr:thioredoxin [Deltaproteobacteria bacterium]